MRRTAESHWDAPELCVRACLGPLAAGAWDTTLVLSLVESAMFVDITNRDEVLEGTILGTLKKASAAAFQGTGSVPL